MMLDLHPEHYRRIREEAIAAQMSEKDFCVLAMHKGVCVLRDLRRDDCLPNDGKT